MQVHQCGYCTQNYPGYLDVLQMMEHLITDHEIESPQEDVDFATVEEGTVFTAQPSLDKPCSRKANGVHETKRGPIGYGVITLHSETGESFQPITCVKCGATNTTSDEGQ